MGLILSRCIVRGTECLLFRVGCGQSSGSSFKINKCNGPVSVIQLFFLDTCQNSHLEFDLNFQPTFWNVISPCCSQLAVVS